MNEPTELPECERCHRAGRDLDVRLKWVNAAREAVIDRRPYTGPMLVLQHRCAPCREASRRPVTRQEEPR